MAPISIELLTLSETTALTGLPVSTLYKYRSEGTFPTPVKLGARSVMWRSDQVNAWLEAKQRAARRHRDP